MCVLVDVRPYQLPGQFNTENGLQFTSVPGILYGRQYEKLGGMDSSNIKLRKRFSFLRNERVHEIVQWCREAVDTANIHTLMEEIQGRRCSGLEKETVMDFLPEAVELPEGVQNRYRYRLA